MLVALAFLLWSGRCIPSSFSFFWVVLLLSSIPSFGWCCLLLLILVGGAASLSSSSCVVLLASSSIGWCCFADWLFGRLGKPSLEGQGRREVRTPSLWCRGFLGCCFCCCWYYVSCCLGLWALALSLSLTFAMVTLLGGAASPSFFWVVLFVARLPLRVLLPPPPFGGAVSLIGFSIVLGTNQFGRSRTLGKYEP